MDRGQQLITIREKSWAMRMRAERNGRGLRKETTSLVSVVTLAIYFGELTFAVAIGIALLSISAMQSFIRAILFCCGLGVWTLADYVIHRFVLHAIATVQHGRHHARPQDAIDKSLAIMVGVRLSIPDGGRRRSIRRSRRLRLVSLCPLLRPSQPNNLDGFVAEASP